MAGSDLHCSGTVSAWTTPELYLQEMFGWPYHLGKHMSQGSLPKPQQTVPRISTDCLQERMWALVLQCLWAVGGSAIHAGETTGRDHADLTAKTKPPTSLPLVKTCRLTLQFSAITERAQETKAGFPLACLMSSLCSSEHRQATCQRTSDAQQGLALI